MNQILYWQKTYRWTLHVIIRTIGTVIRVTTREHTLALHAATKALSPQSLPEVRAMYVPTVQPEQVMPPEQAMPPDMMRQAIDTPPHCGGYRRRGRTSLQPIVFGPRCAQELMREVLKP